MTINSMNITGEGLQIFDPSDGSFTPIDLTTKGDLLVYDGSAYQRIGVGSNDQVLTADSGESTGLKWATNAAGSGAWTFISSTTASNDATIEFTDLDSSYIQYQWVITDLVPETDEVEFRIRTSSDNGSTFDSGASNYDYGYIYQSANSSSNINGFAGGFTYIRLLAGTELGSDTNESGNIILDLFNPSGSGYTMMTARATYMNYVDQLVNNRSAGARLAAEAVDAIQFFMSSGNIESGTFRLYGLTPS